MERMGKCGGCGQYGALGCMPDAYVQKDGTPVVYRGPNEPRIDLCSACMLDEMLDEVEVSDPNEPTPFDVDA